MDINVITKLEVDNNRGDWFELEIGDYATLWLKDGSCMAVEIEEIKDSELLVLNEDEEEQLITFKEIEDIEQG